MYSYSYGIMCPHIYHKYKTVTESEKDLILSVKMDMKLLAFVLFTDVFHSSLTDLNSRVKGVTK